MSTPEDLFELPGDGEGGSGEISDEEYKAAMELIRRANETDEGPKSAGVAEHGG